MTDLETKLRTILTDKETNLLPENLKAGVTCLGVKGTLEGSAKMSIFIQEEEPETKYGLWAKTSPKELTTVFSEEKGYTFTESIFTIDTSVPYTGIWSVYYNGLIYYMPSTDGNRDNITGTTLYSYNPDTELSTPVADLSFAPYRYFLEGDVLYYMNNTNIGRIDLSSDTPTAEHLYSGKQFWNYNADDDGIAFAVHNGYAYFFGGQYVGVARSNGKKLNLSTGAISTITSMSTAYGPTLVIGDYIYVFRGYGTDGSSYKYNTVDGTRTSLASCPTMCSNYAYTPDNKNIYLCSWDDKKTIYKYNIDDNSYTTVGALPDVFSGNYQNSYFDGKTIHYLHSAEYAMNINVYNTEPNSIMVYETFRMYTTKLFGENGPNTYVDEAIVTDENGMPMKDIYVYIGDGDAWI